MADQYAIRSIQELADTVGEPSDAVKQKMTHQLDQTAIEFIESSPLVMVSTYDAEGSIDVSPKGDQPGFVVVRDNKTLLLPERPGNKLAFGFHNILNNGRIGLIFLIPGVTETFRISGRALLSRDPDLLEELAHEQQPALLCTKIIVERCFFHCGKAMIRSSLWQPEHWPDTEGRFIARQAVEKLGVGKEKIEQFDAALEDSYKNTLY